MKTIKGDLILTEDTTFEESIKVEGNIKGYYNLKVTGNINAGNIDAWNIDAGNIVAWHIVAGDIVAWHIVAGDIDAGNINAGDIDAGNINAGNINAGNIDAGNIVAWNIDAGDIVCDKRIKAKAEYKTICRVFVQDKFSLKREEKLST